MSHPPADGSILEATTSGIAVVDLERRIVRFNRALADLLGYPPEQRAQLAPGQPAEAHVRAFMHEHDLAQALRAERGAEVVTPRRYRTRAVRRDGRHLDVAVAATPLIEGDAVVGVVIEVRDAREELELQRQLESTTAEAASILATVPDPIVLVDERGVVLRVNHAVHRVFGWEPEELIGQDVSPLTSAGLEQFATPGTHETMGRRRDGARFPVELSIAEVRGGGSTRHYTCVLRDITDEKRAREELLQAQKSEALGTLVSGVAHDFNNLLTLIAGHLELAASTERPDPRWIENARSATVQATQLVKQLLQFSRRETATREAVDLGAMSEETVGLVRATFDRRIELQLFAPAGLPLVVGDHGQLRQVLMNLLVNARDAVLQRIDAESDAQYRPYIAVALTLGQSPDGLRAGHWLALSVEDNGIGMTHEVRERLFDPFFTTKRRGHGTGLGLATTYGIIDEHGGQISVESTWGEGSVFSVLLPAAEDALRLLPSADAEAAPSGARGASLLIVDDEEPILALMEELLRRAGFAVESAAGGSAAIAAVEERVFDLVLLDVNMPTPNGWQTLTELLRRRPELRVLMASGFASELEAHERGAIGLIDKPFVSTDLLRAIERALSSEAAA